MINQENITAQPTVYWYESKIIHSTTVKKTNTIEMATTVATFVYLTVPSVVPSSPAIKPDETTKTPNTILPKVNNFTRSVDAWRRPYRAADVGIEPPSREPNRAVYLVACDKCKKHNTGHNT